MKLKSFLVTLKSTWLQRKVQLEILIPPGRLTSETGLLMLNDGQDLEKLDLQNSINQMNFHRLMHPFVTVAIHCGERKSEYGVSGYPDYLLRGAKANLYENFVKEELLPFIEKKTGKVYNTAQTYIAGCSLGGLSAFDIAISNQDLFGGAGVFSGSFWWRSKGYSAGYSENDRIIFNKLKKVELNKDFRCWLMAGTDDERNDRNRNGVIDSVDDTLDIYDLLCSKVSISNENIALKIVRGGRHNTKTWEEIFPEFLLHAFGNKN